MRLPLCTVGELGEPGVSIGDGYTCKFSGDGDTTSPEKS
jgi:hypothetical protein